MTQTDAIYGLAGGVLIGLAAAAMLLGNGRIAGVSGIFGNALRNDGERMSRLAFILGLLAGGVILAILWPARMPHVAVAPLEMVLLAGVLVGFGTQLGSGCTSGHGVCGVSRLSPRSLIATGTFMATGAITVALMHALGVSS